MCQNKKKDNELIDIRHGLHGFHGFFKKKTV